MKFNQWFFIKSINDKMFLANYANNKKLGLRFFSKEIGISTPTLSRVLSKKTFEVDTLFKICSWLKMDLNKFVTYDIPGLYESEFDKSHSVNQNDEVNKLCGIVRRNGII